MGIVQVLIIKKTRKEEGKMERKRSILLCFVAILFTVALGCAAIDEMTRPRVTTTGGPTVAQVQAEPYYGPKARIAVAKFTDKTGKGWITSEIGDGMADMLTTALFNTNRFIVLERGIIREIQREREIVERPETAPPRLLEGADLLVTGAVTEFEPCRQAAGAGAGAGIGGGKWRTLVGVLVAFKKAHLAIDLRLVDVATSRIVTATRVQGSALDWTGGVGAITRVPLAAGLGFMSKTPTEEAIRKCLDEAVNFVAIQTPAQYYRPVSPPVGPVPPTAVPTAPAPPQISVPSVPEAEPEKTSIIVVTTPTMIRSDTGAKFMIIEKVPKGAQLTLIDESGKWYKVRTKTGKEGWILKEMVE